MKGFKLKFGVLGKSICVLEKSLKCVFEKGEEPYNHFTVWGGGHKIQGNFRIGQFML